MSSRVQICALVLAASVALVVACSAAQDKSQVQGAAILAGCKAGLDIERDAGEAGASAATERGCEAEIKAWRTAK